MPHATHPSPITPHDFIDKWGAPGGVPGPAFAAPASIEIAPAAMKLVGAFMSPIAATMPGIFFDAT